MGLGLAPSLGLGLFICPGLVLGLYIGIGLGLSVNQLPAPDIPPVAQASLGEINEIGQQE